MNICYIFTPDGKHFEFNRFVSLLEYPVGTYRYWDGEWSFVDGQSVKVSYTDNVPAEFRTKLLLLK